MNRPTVKMSDHSRTLQANAAGLTSDATPEPRCNVTDLRWITITIVNKVGNDPARDSNFTTLVETVKGSARTV